jgi:hypothetical protein
MGLVTLLFSVIIDIRGRMRRNRKWRGLGRIKNDDDDDDELKRALSS